MIRLMILKMFATTAAETLNATRSLECIDVPDVPDEPDVRVFRSSRCSNLNAAPALNRTRAAHLPCAPIRSQMCVPCTIRALAEGEKISVEAMRGFTFVPGGIELEGNPRFTAVFEAELQAGGFQMRLDFYPGGVRYSSCVRLGVQTECAVPEGLPRDYRRIRKRR